MASKATETLTTFETFAMLLPSLMTSDGNKYSSSLIRLTFNSFSHSKNDIAGGLRRGFDPFAETLCETKISLADRRSQISYVLYTTH
jgi:hypothetical protein